jgi:hypothetical protein
MLGRRNQTGRGAIVFSRRVRAFLGVMTTWGVVFSAISLVSFTAMLLVTDIPRHILGFHNLPAIVLRGFLAGALSGGLFAALLMGRERSNSVSTMSIRRVAAWGFLGAATLPFLTVAAVGGFAILPLVTVLTSSLVSGTIGSAIAASTIAIARRAPELPSERRELLG